MTSPMVDSAIFWFRRDLRLADNPGLAAAAAGDRPILPIFVLDDGAPGAWREGGATRWWLHHSLARLDQQLREIGSSLTLLQGDAAAIIPTLAERIGAAAVYCNRHEEPWAQRQQSILGQRLRDRGRALVAGNAALLFEPDQILSQSGQPFRVFTPFWRACLAHPAPPLPIEAPTRLRPLAAKVAGLSLESLGLLPIRPDWSGGLRARWQPGEVAAQTALDDFLDQALAAYAGSRDRPDRPATSCLSPHLRFGEIGPRQVFHRVRQHAPPSRDGDKFLAELGWREFSYHLLAQFPSLPERPLRADFAAFPWRRDSRTEDAWQTGQTGFPLVDAGMRQLWRTGWMHNRVRMVAASCLVKNLLVPWQAGAAWFWDTLVDADLASNSASWQWVAGCGADAAPFFRIFNPVLQGEKFDPEGAYVRRWCPELAHVPDRWLNRPWEAPPAVLADAGVRLGHDYPAPIVDLQASRDRALAAFKHLV